MTPSLPFRLFPFRASVAAVLAIACTSSLAESAGRCTAVAVPTDSQDVTCVLEPAAAGRAVRFVATFGGSHDDTTLALEARLHEEHLVCAPGSITRLQFENGIVELDCRFRVPAGSAPLLEVALTVNHAQYLRASLEFE